MFILENTLSKLSLGFSLSTRLNERKKAAKKSVIKQQQDFVASKPCGDFTSPWTAAFK